MISTVSLLLGMIFIWILSFFVVVSSGDWELFKLSPENKYSTGFRSIEHNFTCPSIRCRSDQQNDLYMHTIAGMDHTSNFPLLVNRVCEALMWCIHPDNFYVILHSADESKQVNVNARFHPRPRIISSSTAMVPEHEDMTHVFDNSHEFLTALSITSRNHHLTQWKGDFTSDKKMMQSLKLLHRIPLNDSSSFIYHSDLDEFPDRRKLSLAFQELRRGSCDVIIGYWKDRLSKSGYPKAVTLQAPLEEQFPVSCRFSSKFMPQRTTQKVLVYPAHLRVSSGQHSVWCDVDVTTNNYHNKKMKNQWIESNRSSSETGVRTQPLKRRDDASCIKHLSLRADKSTSAQSILVTINSIPIHPINVISFDNNKVQSSSLPYFSIPMKLLSVTNSASTVFLPIVIFTHRYDIQELLPNGKFTKPRRCRTKVPINHYKFVAGVEMYLFKRAMAYKRIGLGWWRQSYAMLEHMSTHQGRVCISCPEMNCTAT